MMRVLIGPADRDAGLSSPSLSMPHQLEQVCPRPAEDDVGEPCAVATKDEVRAGEGLYGEMERQP